MCGIVGYIGTKNAMPIVLAGLKRLEYRGYDSAGIAYIHEKKLIINKKFVLLTEKEIQLLELFLGNSQPINRNKILNQVWKYSKDADTHTVETHIYRLRKKVKSEFGDDDFILNEKDGYTL